MRTRGLKRRERIDIHHQMKRHSLDDESTHPGSLIAGSRLPPKRGLTRPGSTLVPSYSVESDYAPGPWSRCADGRRRGCAAELDPVRAAPEAISRSQPDFGEAAALAVQESASPGARAGARADRRRRGGADVPGSARWAAAPAPSDAAPDASVTILDALGFKSDTESTADVVDTDRDGSSASRAVPPPSEDAAYSTRRSASHPSR